MLVDYCRKFSLVLCFTSYGAALLGFSFFAMGVWGLLFGVTHAKSLKTQIASTSEGGSFQLSCRDTHSRALRRITAPCHRRCDESQYFVVNVSDDSPNGAGHDVQSHMFSPTTTDKDKYQGNCYDIYVIQSQYKRHHKRGGAAGVRATSFVVAARGRLLCILALNKVDIVAQHLPHYLSCMSVMVGLNMCDWTSCSSDTFTAKYGAASHRR